MEQIKKMIIYVFVFDQAFIRFSCMASIKLIHFSATTIFLFLIIAANRTVYGLIRNAGFKQIETTFTENQNNNTTSIFVKYYTNCKAKKYIIINTASIFLIHYNNSQAKKKNNQWYAIWSKLNQTKKHIHIRHNLKGQLTALSLSLTPW